MVPRPPGASKQDSGQSRPGASPEGPPTPSFLTDFGPGRQSCVERGGRAQSAQAAASRGRHREAVPLLRSGPPGALEMIVGVDDFGEAGFARAVPAVRVGMEAFDQFLVARLDLGLGRGLFETQ